MPTQPPRFRHGLARPVAKAWSAPGLNTRRRKRGRAAQRERAQILAEEPLCRPCLAAGRVTASEQVDHIDNTLPDPEWDARANKQGICKPCHRAKTAAEAAAGRRVITPDR